MANANQASCPKGGEGALDSAEEMSMFILNEAIPYIMLRTAPPIAQKKKYYFFVS